jgi:hypothetical protein
MAVRAPLPWPQVGARYDRNALIFADLSNDTKYAEQLLETFGPRVIGVHISRHGNGMQVERRPVGRGSIPIYHVGRSHLLEALHSDLQVGRVCFADGAEAQRAYAQLEALEHHPHLDGWRGHMVAARPPKPRRQTYGWGAFA